MDYCSLPFLLLMTSIAVFGAGEVFLPNYTTLVAVCIAAMNVAVIFYLLSEHHHKKIAIGFAILLLLVSMKILSMPFGSNAALQELTAGNFIVFFVYKFWMPIGALIALVFLIVHPSIWEPALKKIAQIYVIIAAPVATVLLYNTATVLKNTEEIHAITNQFDATAVMLSAVLIVLGLLLVPMYISYRATIAEKNTHQNHQKHTPKQHNPAHNSAQPTPTTHGNAQ